MKTTLHQQISQHNLILINQSLKGFPKLEPTKVFDEAFQRPISEWRTEPKQPSSFIRDLIVLWKMGFNRMLN